MLRDTNEMASIQISKRAYSEGALATYDDGVE
jgi:hypothetical protein